MGAAAEFAAMTAVAIAALAITYFLQGIFSAYWVPFYLDGYPPTRPWPLQWRYFVTVLTRVIPFIFGVAWLLEGQGTFPEHVAYWLRFAVIPVCVYLIIDLVRVRKLREPPSAGTDELVPSSDGGLARRRRAVQVVTFGCVIAASLFVAGPRPDPHLDTAARASALSFTEAVVAGDWERAAALSDPDVLADYVVALEGAEIVGEPEVSTKGIILLRSGGTEHFEVSLDLPPSFSLDFIEGFPADQAIDKACLSLFMHAEASGEWKVAEAAASFSGC